MLKNNIFEKTFKHVIDNESFNNIINSIRKKELYTKLPFYRRTPLKYNIDLSTKENISFLDINVYRQFIPIRRDYENQNRRRGPVIEIGFNNENGYDDDYGEPIPDRDYDKTYISEELALFSSIEDNNADLINIKSKLLIENINYRETNNPHYVSHIRTNKMCDFLKNNSFIDYLQDLYDFYYFDNKSLFNDFDIKIEIDYEKGFMFNFLKPNNIPNYRTSFNKTLNKNYKPKYQTDYDILINIINYVDSGFNNIFSLDNLKSTIDKYNLYANKLNLTENFEAFISEFYNIYNGTVYHLDDFVNIGEDSPLKTILHNSEIHFLSSHIPFSQNDINNYYPLMIYVKDNDRIIPVFPGIAYTDIKENNGKYIFYNHYSNIFKRNIVDYEIIYFILTKYIINNLLFIITKHYNLCNNSSFENLKRESAFMGVDNYTDYLAFRNLQNSLDKYTVDKIAKLYKRFISSQLQVLISNYDKYKNIYNEKLLEQHNSNIKMLSDKLNYIDTLLKPFLLKEVI